MRSACAWTAHHGAFETVSTEHLLMVVRPRGNGLVWTKFGGARSTFGYVHESFGLGSFHANTILYEYKYDLHLGTCTS